METKHWWYIKQNRKLVPKTADILVQNQRDKIIAVLNTKRFSSEEKRSAFSHDFIFLSNVFKFFYLEISTVMVNEIKIMQQTTEQYYYVD